MNIENLLYTLPYIAKGIVGIFVVTAIIILCIYGLNKLTSKK